jgi:tetratricopeptide (TPR) repeat protein
MARTYPAVLFHAQRTAACGPRRALLALTLLLAAPTCALAARSGEWAVTARSELDLAERAVAEGRLAAAAEHYERARRASAASGGLLLARALDGMADLAALRGDLAAAADGYGRAATIFETALGPNQPRLATTLHNLGVVQARLGRTAPARAALERALAIWDATLGPASTEAVNSRRALALVASAPAPG